MGADEGTHMAAQPEPAASVLQQIARTYFDLLPVFERYVGASRARWGIVATLAQQGAASQAALAERLRVDGAAITRQIKHLEAEGLVRRWTNPHDNRLTCVELTDAGRALAMELRYRRDAFEALATAGLSADEIAVLLRCLARIQANVRAAEIQGAGE